MKKLKIILGLAVLVLALPLTPAQARLGDTVEEIRGRYGSTGRTKAEAAVTEADGTIKRLNFWNGSVHVTVDIIDGLSARETYGSKTIELGRVIPKLLEINSQGSRWGEPQIVAPIRSYRRDDGLAFATFDGETLTATTDSFAEAEEAAKSAAAEKAVGRF